MAVITVVSTFAGVVTFLSTTQKTYLHKRCIIVLLCYFYFRCIDLESTPPFTCLFAHTPCPAYPSTMATRECSALWGEPERATKVCCRLSSTVENGTLSLIFRRTRSFAWCRDSVIPSEARLYPRSIDIFRRRRRQPEVGLKTSISQEWCTGSLSDWQA